MDYEVDVNLPGRTSGITVCGDGEVDIVVQGGYEDISVSFELEELEEMVRQARAHKDAYDAFIANDYEDVVMPTVGAKVQPDWGRHAGKWGEIVKVDPENLSVMIDFGGFITTADGSKMPDQYWSSIKKIVLKV